MDQDLHSLKDDMIAFIEGHGLRRFNAYVSEEVPNVPWSADEDHPDAWKDFVELAKASGVSFVTMNFVHLDREDVDLLLNRLTTLRHVDRATVAGYYGSDSAGTFATCVAVLVGAGGGALVVALPDTTRFPPAPSSVSVLSAARSPHRASATRRGGSLATRI